MRKVIGLWLMSVCIIGAAHAQTISVKSDQRLDTDFSKYKTFSWASQIDSKLDEGFYFLNDLAMKNEIRDAVKGELLGLSYKLKPTEPDLIVNFRVFEEPVTLKGYDGYGTDYWGGDKYREVSDTTSYDLKAGTRLVSLADRKSGTVVWQGFASGLIKDNAFIKEKGKIYEAVNMIFEEYDQRAKEYTRK